MGQAVSVPVSVQEGFGRCLAEGRAAGATSRWKIASLADDFG
jgi:hypothetical protein